MEIKYRYIQKIKQCITTTLKHVLHYHYLTCIQENLNSRNYSQRLQAKFKNEKKKCKEKQFYKGRKERKTIRFLCSFMAYAVVVMVMVEALVVVVVVMPGYIFSTIHFTMDDKCFRMSFRMIYWTDVKII